MKNLALLLLLAGPAFAGPMDKSERRLVVVASLETFGVANYKWLYRFLDGFSISMGERALRRHYGSLTVLPRQRATRRGFVEAVSRLADEPKVQAIDVILSLHGSSGSLTFDDGAVAMSDLENQLRAVRGRGKFRLLYNQACYGESHNRGFLAGGFRTAVGSRRVNASAASEYPVFLRQWGAGRQVGSIFATTNADPALYVADKAASVLGFADTDSVKVVAGAGSLRIR